MFDSTLLQQRSAFSADDLATASPRRVLVKCFDRLDVDLEQALVALDTADHEAVNRLLGHAQDLLGEVARMVNADAWQHADSLLSVYDYVLRLLAVGNMQKAPGAIQEARTLLRELGDAFREATRSIEQSGVTPTPPAENPAFGATPLQSAAAADTAARRSGFSALA